MKKLVAWSVLIVCACAVSAFAQNKVVFDNQSGEPALVKLIGPTRTQVEVPNGAKVGADAVAGRYIIKVRYGVQGKYRYSKGEEFEVKGTTTTRSETTITLHKVAAGNYSSQAISEKEFGAVTAHRKVAEEITAFAQESITYVRIPGMQPNMTLTPEKGKTFLIVVVPAAVLKTHSLDALADMKLTLASDDKPVLRGVGLGVGSSHVEFLSKKEFVFQEPAERVEMADPGTLVMAYETIADWKSPVTLSYKGDKYAGTLMTHDEWKKQAEPLLPPDLAKPPAR